MKDMSLVYFQIIMNKIGLYNENKNDVYDVNKDISLIFTCCDVTRAKVSQKSV